MVVEVDVKAPQLRQILADIKAFDPKLATATRRRIRQAGRKAIDAMRAKLDETPPTGGASSVGSREELRRQLRVKVLTSKRSEGVRLVGSGDAFARSYNLTSWRHPVRGTNLWVEQEGRPYFGQTVMEMADEIREEVLAALDEALAVIARRTP